MADVPAGSAGPWTDYTWILVAGCIVAFAFAWSIGANDVANAFGTSVGAKTLQLWQACVIAMVFEFLGALTLGSSVTTTIAKDISNPEKFESYPEIYMYGMLCSLTAATFWVTLATYWELAVSSTHSVIGGVIGFSLVWGQGSGVHWVSKADSFPYFAGVLPIVLSWVASPLIAGLLAAFTFLCTRTLILRRRHSHILALWSLPVLVFVTILVDLFFVLLKGVGQQLSWDDVQCFWVSAAVAGGLAVLVAAIGLPLLARHFNTLLKKESTRQRAPVTPPDLSARATAHPSLAMLAAAGESQNGVPPAHVVVRLESPPSEAGGSEAADGRSKAAVVAATATGVWDTALARGTAEPGFTAERISWRQVIQSKVQSLGAVAYRAAIHGLVQDVHEGLENDDVAVAMHQAAEIFEPQAEIVFKYLQVVSACCVAFAHGSNDVANAVGPLAAIYHTYRTETVPNDDMNVSEWILAIGGAGIVVGLMTYGYNIIRALGVKMAKMTPSRGYSAELSVALTVAMASAWGMPVSTTHCIVGAEIGVGMCESISTGVNWLLAAKTGVSWIATMAVTGLLAAGLFAQGVYAPSITQERALHAYDVTARGIIDGASQLINASNARLDVPLNLSALMATLHAGSSQACSGGHVVAEDCTAALRFADAALKALSLVAVGFNVSAPNYTNSSVSIPALP